VANKPSSEEEWRRVLTGEIPGLRTFQRILRKIPSEPRCKLCYAPFGTPGNVFIRLLGGKPSPMNRRLCTWCIKSAHKHPGGAEVEISALFADVRGSTGLAEQLRPASSASS
jgi:adenylate cyclase